MRFHDHLAAVLSLCWLTAVAAPGIAQEHAPTGPECAAAIPEIEASGGGAESLNCQNWCVETDETTSRSDCFRRCFQCAGTKAVRLAQLESGAQQEDLLETALEAYSTSYFTYGRSGQGALELAELYMGLDKPKDAAAILKDYAFTSTEGNSDRFFIAAGDVYREMGAVKKARKAYEQAQRFRPSNRTASRRLLSLGAEKPGKLLKDARRFRDRGMLELVLEALEKVIPLTVETRKEMASEALVTWVEVASRLGNVDRDRARRLPTEWPSSGLEELLAILEAANLDASTSEANPKKPEPKTMEEALQELSWWVAGDPRRGAIASLLLDLGSQATAQREYTAARLLLQAAWTRAPDPDDDLDESPLIRLKVGDRLGRLLYSHRDLLDPDGRGVTEIEDSLLADLEKLRTHPPWRTAPKALWLLQEYQARTALLILDRERAVGGPTREGEMAPRALLEGVLELASRQLEGDPDDLLEEPPPNLGRPWPQIHRALADIELAEEEPDMDIVIGHLTEGAAGYLDVDAQTSALKMLAQAKELVGDQGVPAKTRQIENLIEQRRNLDLTLPEDGCPSLGERYPALRELPGGFLRRQQFKLEVDAGRKAAAAGHDAKALSLHICALKDLGVREAQDGELSPIVTLTSSQDIDRVEAALHSILNRTPPINLGTSIQFDSDFGLWYEKGRVFPLPEAEPTATRLAVGMDVFLAAELRDLLVREVIAFEEPVTMSLSKQYLHIYPGTNGEDVGKELKELIYGANIEGLKKPSVFTGTGRRTKEWIW